VSLGTRTPSGGMATLTTSSLPQGNDSITAQIAAGGNFSSATSPAIIQAVNAASPGIAVATSGTPSNHGQTVTFTATVSGGCTGTVTFYDGGSAIGTGAVNGTTATLATGSLAVGAHSITASLPAAGQCSAMTSNPINQAVNTLYDSGTVTLTVSNSGGAVFTSSTSYGQASTPESVAEALAGSDSNVNVTAVNDALYIEAAGTGTTTDYSYAVSSSWNSIFANPSFQGSPPSGALTGGAGSGGGQTAVYSYTVGYDLAGNVTGFTDSVNGTWSSIVYDTLNRIQTAASVPAPGQPANPYPYTCWSYDNFGNRTQQMSASVAFPGGQGGPNACSTTGSLGANEWAQYNGTVNGTGNNQMSATNQNPNQGQPGGYDAAGDVTYDGVNEYLYDGEGRICAVSSTPVPGFTTMTGYVYDAEGNRVAKGTITTVQSLVSPSNPYGMSCDPSVNGLMTANGNETDYILGPGGEQVTELAQDANGTMNWQRTYVYAAGALIATYDPNPDNPSQPLPSFRLTDWLGTLRATTDAYGVAQGTCTGLPFGDGVTCSGDIPDNHHFTGKERDAESGNDYFEARYYSSTMGRFLSPDWSAKEEPVPYAKLDNPQSLNLYSYVLNNPITAFDNDGHEIIFAANATQVMRDSVQAILADPNTRSNLAGYVGPNNPNLTIQSGDLSSMDSHTLTPDGTPGASITQGVTEPDIQTTSGSSTDANGRVAHP